MIRSSLTTTQPVVDRAGALDVLLTSSSRQPLQQSFWQLIDDTLVRLHAATTTAPSISHSGVLPHQVEDALGEIGFKRDGATFTFTLPQEMAWDPMHQEGLAAMLVGGRRLLAQVMHLQRTYPNGQGPSIDDFKRHWPDSSARLAAQRTLHPAAKSFFEHAEKLFNKKVEPAVAKKEGCFRAHGWLYLAMLEQDYPIEDIKGACNLAMRLRGIKPERPDVGPAPGPGALDAGAIDLFESRSPAAPTTRSTTLTPVTPGSGDAGIPSPTDGAPILASRAQSPQAAANRQATSSPVPPRPTPGIPIAEAARQSLTPAPAPVDLRTAMPPAPPPDRLQVCGPAPSRPQPPDDGMVGLTLRSWPLRALPVDVKWIARGICPPGTEAQKVPVVIDQLRWTFARGDLLRLLQNPRPH
jgi:hypothetical protein